MPSIANSEDAAQATSDSLAGTEAGLALESIESGRILAQPQTPLHSELEPNEISRRRRSPAAWQVLASAALLAGIVWIWPRSEEPNPTPAVAAAMTVTRSPRATFTPAPSAEQTAEQTSSTMAAGAAALAATPTNTLTARPMSGENEPAIAVRGLLTASVRLRPVVPILPLLPVTEFDPASVVVPPMVEEVIVAPLPEVQVIPIPGLEPTPTAEPSPTALPTLIPEPIIVEQQGPSRQWSDFLPRSPVENDHFWVENPFLATDYNLIGAPSYQFGSTGGGRYRAHHGLDISNPFGTPVRAGVVGEVVHAGLDDPNVLGPYANFYGNAVVIRLDQKLPLSTGLLDVFLLYGHLSQVNATVGQRVQPGDIVGQVGMTGIAIGPHLHVEMRVGDNTYEKSVNPYLWLKPLEGNGAVAVRLITADGKSWPGARMTLARFEDGVAVWGRMIETYLDNENIGPNPSWGENGAMGDVPAGYYVLVGNVNGESVRAEFFVRANETTFVEVRTKQ